MRKTFSHGITFCSVDQGYYIVRNGMDIHFQQRKPTETEIREAFASDDWETVFNQINYGLVVRISSRIFWHMQDNSSLPGPGKHYSDAKNEAFTMDHNSKTKYLFWYDHSTGLRYGKLIKADIELSRMKFEDLLAPNFNSFFNDQKNL